MKLRRIKQSVPVFLGHHVAYYTSHVTPTTAVRDLRIYVNADSSMTAHITKTVSACFAVLHQL